MNTPTTRRTAQSARPRYIAHLSGSSFSRGPSVEFTTITAARKWAEEYGTTADLCTIEDRKGRTVGVHRRGPGADWYKASF